MANFSHLPLQEAIYTVLTGDTTLMGLVAGIYDRPPQGSAYPYITIGESAGSDWSSVTTTGMEQLVVLHIWSRAGGRKEAASIMARLYTLLHDVNFAVSGQTLVMMRFAGSGLTLESDGWTYQGAMHFRALLQSN